MASFPGMKRKTGSRIRKKIRRESGANIGKTGGSKASYKMEYCKRAATTRDCPQGHVYKGNRPYHRMSITHA